MLSEKYFDSPDVQTYMNIANGKFDNQSLVRRYRIVIPFLAKVFSIPIEKVYKKIWKNRVHPDDPLKFSFFLVNLTIMAIVGIVIFHLCCYFCQDYFLSFFSTLIFLLAGRWGSLIAGLPYTDSLYILVISLLWLGLLKNNRTLITLSLILGFVAKESFVLFLPLLALGVSRKNIVLVLTALLLGISLAFGVRWVIDSNTHTQMMQSLEEDVEHIHVIGLSLLRIAQPRGIGELMTPLGVFSILNLIGIISGIKFWQAIIPKLGISFWMFTTIIWIHALLSNEVGRMLYIGGAAWTIFLCMTIKYHPLFSKFYQNLLNFNQ